MTEDIITLNEEVNDVDAVPKEAETDIPPTDTATEETQSSTDDSEPKATDTEKKDEIEILQKELENLRYELEEKKKTFERMSREIGEFSEIFPERNVSTIPDSVWENVKAGIPLAAAYALYERKNALRADTANRINERNGAVSTGSVGRANTENFYTPDEVRAMSRSEVRKNYSKILESMKKWN